jgi:hypothetical protein
MVGGSARPGGGGGESNRSQISLPSRPKYTIMGKTGGFMLILAYKSLNSLFFPQKYLTRYNPETFFEEYIN